MNMLLREAISFPVLDQAVEWAKRRSRILGTMQIVRKEDDDLHCTDLGTKEIYRW